MVCSVNDFQCKFSYKIIFETETTSAFFKHPMNISIVNKVVTDYCTQTIKQTEIYTFYPQTAQHKFSEAISRRMSFK